MAKVTNAFTTYQATGNREDLSNAIYNIDPFDTPVMSAVRRRNVKNRLFDWQTEFLPTVAPSYPTSGYNAQFEGFQLSNGPSQPTIRQNNVTQISERDATVSGSQEASDAAGKGSEMAHQMAMMSKVLEERHRDGALWSSAAGYGRRYGADGARHRRHCSLARACGRQRIGRQRGDCAWHCHCGLAGAVD